MSSLTRMIPRPERRGNRYDDYAFCSEDRYWFRPSYTDGKCPLCGQVAPTGAPQMSFMQRLDVDRSWFGVAGLALESLGMLALVLFMFFHG